MANADNAYGFKPWGPLLSSLRFRVRGNDNHPVFVNDVVGLFDSAGYVTAAAAGATTIIGVSLTFLTGAVTGTIMATVDPDQLLECQNDGTEALTDIGATADHAYTFGSFQTRRSKSELDTSDVSVTAGGFTILDELAAPDNATGANARMIVSHTTEHIRRVATGY